MVLSAIPVQESSRQASLDAGWATESRLRSHTWQIVLPQGPWDDFRRIGHGEIVSPSGFLSFILGSRSHHAGS